MNLIQIIKQYFKNMGIDLPAAEASDPPTTLAEQYEHQRQLFIDQQLPLDRYQPVPLSDTTLQLDTTLAENPKLHPGDYISDIPTFSLVLCLHRLHLGIVNHQLQTQDATLFYIADHLKRAQDFDHISKVLKANQAEQQVIVDYLTSLNHDISEHLSHKSEIKS